MCLTWGCAWKVASKLVSYRNKVSECQPCNLSLGPVAFRASCYLLIPSPSPAWAGPLSSGIPVLPTLPRTKPSKKACLVCTRWCWSWWPPGTVAVPPFGKATGLGHGDGHPRPSQSCRCSGLHFHEVPPRVRANRNSVSDIPVLS